MGRPWSTWGEVGPNGLILSELARVRAPVAWPSPGRKPSSRQQKAHFAQPNQGRLVAELHWGPMGLESKADGTGCLHGRVLTMCPFTCPCLLRAGHPSRSSSETTGQDPSLGALESQQTGVVLPPSKCLGPAAAHEEAQAPDAFPQLSDRSKLQLLERRSADEAGSSMEGSQPTGRLPSSTSHVWYATASRQVRKGPYMHTCNGGFYTSDILGLEAS